MQLISIEDLKIRMLMSLAVRIRNQRQITNICIDPSLYKDFRHFNLIIEWRMVEIMIKCSDCAG